MGEVVPLVSPCQTLIRVHGPFAYVSCACLRTDYWVSTVHGIEDALAVIHAAKTRRGTRDMAPEMLRN